MRLFVWFWHFQNYFQEKNNRRLDGVSLLAQRYDFISDTVTSGNATENKQAKVQIIAGYLSNLVACKLSPMGNHHHLCVIYEVNLDNLSIFQPFANLRAAKWSNFFAKFWLLSIPKWCPNFSFLCSADLSNNQINELRVLLRLNYHADKG